MVPAEHKANDPTSSIQAGAFPLTCLYRLTQMIHHTASIRCLAGGRWHIVLHVALELTLQSLKLFDLLVTTQPSNEVSACGSTCYINHIFVW